MRPYDIELDIGGLTLEVSGYYTPPTAENKSGHPDTWAPAEAGELEVMEVAAEGKPLKCDLRAFEEAWGDYIWEKL
ncbi:hypothetical protein [Candidatus Proelusimicrobium volucris]|uniref:hypothetical protein n=1 Tax=Candidatus Proelusimicrobium volucris TaxID=3416225 RepID=UPI003D100CE3